MVDAACLQTLADAVANPTVVPKFSAQQFAAINDNHVEVLIDLAGKVFRSLKNFIEQDLHKSLHIGAILKCRSLVLEF